MRFHRTEKLLPFESVSEKKIEENDSSKVTDIKIFLKILASL